jgi:hypothetical protein
MNTDTKKQKRAAEIAAFADHVHEASEPDALMQHTLSELERYIQRCHRLGKKVLHGAHRQWDASLIRYENQRNN